MAVIATGFFDGVHLGHRCVIDTLLCEARRRSEEAVVITFWPHPRAVLQSDARNFRLLTSLEEKKALLMEMGVDRVEMIPFSREFASMTAYQYVHLLHERFGASCLVLGYDTHFGSDQMGPEEISSIATALSLPCVSVLPVSNHSASTDVNASGVCSARSACNAVGFADPTASGPPSYIAEGGMGSAGTSGTATPAISSTSIRKALEKGDVESAARMLGRHYSLHGVVVCGNQLGRTIGFPTANMQLYEPLKLVPGRGVYLVEVETLGRRFHGMTNIGVRPTVGNGSNVTIETNIFDFDEMIYGLDISLSFILKIRDERRFPSLDELSARLSADRDDCLARLQTSTIPSIH